MAKSSTGTPMSPVRVGVLHDFPWSEGGREAFDAAVGFGVEPVVSAGRIPPVELVHAQVRGLPLPDGSAYDIERGFRELQAAEVIAIIGPGLTDSTFVAQPLCDAAAIAAINYAGVETSRSEFMFHYQIGSLEEEPAILSRHIRTLGHAGVVLIHDSSYIGRRKAEFFIEASTTEGLALLARSEVSSEATDLRPEVGRLRPMAPDVVVYLGLWEGARALSLALAAAGWTPPVMANSALLMGYLRPEWARGWEGWTYVDTVSDANAIFGDLAARMGGGAPSAPLLAGFRDIGRLIAEGIARAPYRAPSAVKDGLERVKLLPSASGQPGTRMGFGHWERSALKGRYLVLRQWQDGRSVEVEEAEVAAS
jgi:ABC-type branched-subunit amino acid transport system substrate-binding protein